MGRQVLRDISLLSSAAGTSAMATVDITCKGCEYDYWELIAKFHSKDFCYKFLMEHGVLPAGVECPECRKPCKPRSDRLVTSHGGQVGPR